jgi:hypothetical protein
MSTPAERKPQSTITRQFEPLRHGSDHLAAAFERALPTITRVVKDRTATTAAVHPHRVVRAAL